MEKKLEISQLNDLYGGLLTEKQRSILCSYYDYDLSLGEIGEAAGITRQAVLDSLKKSENQLYKYESLLKLYYYKNSLRIALQAQDGQELRRTVEAILGEISW